MDLYKLNLTPKGENRLEKRSNYLAFQMAINEFGKVIIERN
jgi:hypothetical protein